MKNNDQTSQIRIESLESHIKDKASVSDEQYSILKYSKRQSNEIAEIAAASEHKYIVDLITVSPRRLAFYETIVTIETEVKIRNSDDLPLIFNQIYQDHVVPLLKSKNLHSKKKLEDQILEEVEQKISAQVNAAFKDFKASELVQNAGTLAANSNLEVEHKDLVEEIRTVHNEVKRRGKEGLYIPGEYSFTETYDSITKKIVFDRLYNKTMPYKIKTLIQPLILDLLAKKAISYPKPDEFGKIKPLESLPTHQGSRRYTFMMIGAPASGKSTSFATILYNAKELGIDISDLVKSNTDSYRNLVSNSKELGANQIQHASGNYDESYLITKRVYNSLKAKIQDPLGKGAPHMLIDAVYPTQEKISLGVMNGGNLQIYCISVPVEVSINRALARGKATGKYIDTSLLIKSHRDISANFYQILIKNKDSNIDFVLLDNNAPLNKGPTLVEAGSLSNKIIEIYSLAKIAEFLAKKYTNSLNNSMSITRSDLPLSDKEIELVAEHIRELEQSGFKIEQKEEFAQRILQRSSTKRSIDLLKLRVALEEMNDVSNKDYSTPKLNSNNKNNTQKKSPRNSNTLTGI